MQKTGKIQDVHPADSARGNGRSRRAEQSSVVPVLRTTIQGIVQSRRRMTETKWTDRRKSQQQLVWMRCYSGHLTVFSSTAQVVSVVGRGTRETHGFGGVTAEETGSHASISCIVGSERG